MLWPLSTAAWALLHSASSAAFIPGAGHIDPSSVTQALARGARALSVDLIQTTTDRPLDAVLSTYLTRRSARARGGGR